MKMLCCTRAACVPTPGVLIQPNRYAWLLNQPSMSSLLLAFLYSQTGMLDYPFTGKTVASVQTSVSLTPDVHIQPNRYAWGLHWNNCGLSTNLCPPYSWCYAVQLELLFSKTSQTHIKIWTNHQKPTNTHHVLDESPETNQTHIWTNHQNPTKHMFEQITINQPNTRLDKPETNQKCLEKRGGHQWGVVNLIQFCWSQCVIVFVQVLVAS